MYQKRRDAKPLRDYVSFSTKGATWRFDCTPMRLCLDGFLKYSAETYVRCATFHSATTGPLGLLPVSSCPETRDSSGIFSSIRLEGVNISVHAGSKGFKFISIVFAALVFRQVRKRGLILRGVSTFCKPQRGAASGNSRRWSTSE